MYKVITGISIVLIMCLSIGKSYGQTRKNHLGINYLYYAGVNYERVVSDQRSISLAINKHDWNYANIHKDISLLKVQLAFRFYDSNTYGFYLAPCLTYRYRDDPSIREERGNLILGSRWGQEDPVKKYSIKLHSIGLACAGGYRSKLIFNRLSIDTSLRIGGFPVNKYRSIALIDRDDNNNIIFNDDVSDEVKRNIARRLIAEFVLSARICYSF